MIIEVCHESCLTWLAGLKNDSPLNQIQISDAIIVLALFPSKLGLMLLLE